MHAVTDAILGALGEPDIGQLFPDNAPENDGRDSRVFLEEAVRRMRAKGWTIGNMDMTVICERPKMGPRKREVVENLAHILGVPAADLNLKGKTHERVDAVGEGRAIEAHVVALLVRGI
jgi:2-C-methyl-D-erythritol 2,4-cyclodiphosphate synthase